LNCWRRAGSLGHAAAFSFYPGKNLGACGEAGAVTTNSEELARRIRILRDHGQAQKYYHDVEGYNGRLDSLQAGMLTVKLQHLTEWNRLRRERARTYCELLSSVAEAIVRPYEPSWSRAVYHLYVVRVKDRDQAKAHLASIDIGTGIHYPIPLHLQKAYSYLRHSRGDFPVSERIAPEILSLPMFPNLRIEEQERVVCAIIEFLNASRVSAQALSASV
jgi:dTDP-4-amino-4,6-dideoxygalactose transaminase